jgi:hypothetical protein
MLAGEMLTRKCWRMGRKTPPGKTYRGIPALREYPALWGSPVLRVNLAQPAKLAFRENPGHPANLAHQVKQVLRASPALRANPDLPASLAPRANPALRGHPVNRALLARTGRCASTATALPAIASFRLMKIGTTGLSWPSISSSPA